MPYSILCSGLHTIALDSSDVGRDHDLPQSDIFLSTERLVSYDDEYVETWVDLGSGTGR